MFYICIFLVDTQLYILIKTQWIVHLKLVNFIVRKLYFSKANFWEKEGQIIIWKTLQRILRYGPPPQTLIHVPHLADTRQYPFPPTLGIKADILQGRPQFSFPLSIIARMLSKLLLWNCLGIFLRQCQLGPLHNHLMLNLQVVTKFLVAAYDPINQNTNL